MNKCVCVSSEHSFTPANAFNRSNSTSVVVCVSKSFDRIKRFFVRSLLSFTSLFTPPALSSNDSGCFRFRGCVSGRFSDGSEKELPFRSGIASFTATKRETEMDKIHLFYRFCARKQNCDVNSNFEGELFIRVIFWEHGQVTFDGDAIKWQFFGGFAAT